MFNSKHGFELTTVFLSQSRKTELNSSIGKHILLMRIFSTKYLRVRLIKLVSICCLDKLASNALWQETSKGKNPAWIISFYYYDSHLLLCFLKVTNNFGMTAVADLEFPLIDEKMQIAKTNEILKDKNKTHFSTYCVASGRH